MANDALKEYAHCSECSASNSIIVINLFGEPVGYSRFGGSHRQMWTHDDGDWYCPAHAHIGVDMERDTFERLRDGKPDGGLFVDPQEDSDD